jgi:hypothetical protein
MENDTEELIRKWVKPSIRRVLVKYRNGLVDDLDSDEPEVCTRAQMELLRVLDWLEPPMTSESIEHGTAELRRKIEQTLIATGHSVTSVKKLLKASSRMTVRERGRPRTRGRAAIRAFDLRHRANKTWREIVLEIDGSCKKRRCLYFCGLCGDVARSTTPAARPRRRLQEHCSRCRFLRRPAPKREQVCFKCADAMADLVNRLEAVS